MANEHYQSAEQREELIFRLLLVSKWFLIPTSVAYEWILSTSHVRAITYNIFLPSTVIIYTAISLTLIIWLWLEHRRIAEGKSSKRKASWTTLLSIVSFAVDMLFVFFLIVVPTAGNSLWFLFLPPLSLALLVPRVEKIANWVVDGTAAAVVLISIYGLLLTYESPTSVPHYTHADYLLCLSGLMFMWVCLRYVRGWIDQVHGGLNRLEHATALNEEIFQRFPAEFMLVDEQGVLVKASEEARKALSLPHEGSQEWPEKAQSIRNALLLRFHAETEMEKTITIPDDEYTHPIKIYPTFFAYGGRRYCIAVAQEEYPELAKSGGVVRSDRLTIAGQIAAGLAHEIGNPLGVIRSCADYLRQKLEKEDPNREECELILEEAQRCQDLIDRLLTLASPKRDRPAVHDLRVLLERSISMVKYQAGEREIELENPSQPVSIYVNEGQLMAVLVNLYLNALQSMENSPREAKLRVHMHVRGEEAIIDVTDEGSGISSEELEKIFDPFFTKRAAGTGLGLSIVHQIVTSLGGRIDVASTMGSGTTFTVTLPMYRGDDDSSMR